MADSGRRDPDKPNAAKKEYAESDADNSSSHATKACLAEHTRRRSSVTVGDELHDARMKENEAHKAVQAAAEKEYLERMELEYAKREGGA